MKIKKAEKDESCEPNAQKYQRIKVCVKENKNQIQPQRAGIVTYICEHTYLSLLEL